MTTATEEMVTIPLARFERLQDRSFKLNCLENFGVDNWEGYYEALKEGGYYDDEDDE